MLCKSLVNCQSSADCTSSACGFIGENIGYSDHVDEAFIGQGEGVILEEEPYENKSSSSAIRTIALRISLFSFLFKTSDRKLRSS